MWSSCLRGRGGWYKNLPLLFESVILTLFLFWDFLVNKNKINLVTFFSLAALIDKHLNFNHIKMFVMKKLTLLAAAILLITLFFTSCEKEALIAPNQTAEERGLEAEADTILAELSKEISLGGFEFMDRAEYDKIPMVEIASLPSLVGEDEVITRGAPRLPTPPVVNQGNEGSCAAFAVGYVGVSYYLNRRKGMPYSVTGAYRSPEFLYNNTKLYGDCNAGSNFSTVLNFLKTTGTCSWSQMPYSTTNGCANRGTSTQRTQALAGKIKSWRTVSKSVSNLRNLVDLGYPVLMGFLIDDRFITQTKNYPYTYTSKGGRNQGGHAVVIMGYDDSRRVFVVQNSWGTSQHDRGFFYVSYDLLPLLDLELFVIDPAI